MTVDLTEFRKTPRHKQVHPKGYEPGIQYDPTKGGTIATGPIADEPTDGIWADLIADFGLNPATTSVVPGSVQVRAWDTAGGERLKYYRATLTPTARWDDHADIEALKKLIEKKRPAKPKALTTTGERALLVLLSDWQLGKGEGGGTEATVQRILSSFDRIRQHVIDLKKLGRPVSSLYFVGLGDMIEQCSGHYDMQAFQTDLDRREQMQVARRLILAAADVGVDLGLPTILAAVAGNHGENRRNGKAFTTWTDNDDLAVFEQVAEIIEYSDRYSSVYVPTGAIAEDLSLVLDIAGVPCGFAHGHQIRGAAGAEGWWKGQALGRQPVADAEILFTGHKHNLQVSESTGRTWIQAPAMDGGSYWWTSQTGQSSPAGMLTLVVGTDAGPRGWGELQVL